MKADRGPARRAVNLSLRAGLRLGSTQILALSVGILAVGLSAAVFYATYTLAIRPLPFRKPGQLVVLARASLSAVSTSTAVPGSVYAALRRGHKALSELAAVRTGHEIMRTPGAPASRVNVADVTPGFLKLLGTADVIGPGAAAQTDRWPGGDSPVILSRRFWRTRFGRQALLTSLQVNLNGQNARVVGVTPRGFEFPDVGPPVDIIRIIPEPVVAAGQPDFYFQVIGRLAPGWSIPQASAAVAALSQHAKNPEFAQGGAQADLKFLPLQAWMRGKSGKALFLMVDAAALLLLLALANILLLRTSAALDLTRNCSIKLALGAGPRCLTTEILTGGIAFWSLTAAGGALAATACFTLLTRTTALMNADLPRLRAAPLLYATPLAVAALGLAICEPLCARAVLRSAVRSVAGARSATPPTSHMAQNAIIVCELALAVVLAAGAGLLARTAQNLAAVPLGFEPSGWPSAKLNFPCRARSRDRHKDH